MYVVTERVVIDPDKVMLCVSLTHTVLLLFVDREDNIEEMLRHFFILQ